MYFACPMLILEAVKLIDLTACKNLRGKEEKRTLADAAVRGAAHMKACVTTAVLSLVHFSAAGFAAKFRIIHYAPLRRG